MHEVWICDARGTRLALLDKVQSFRYTKVVNAVGNWSATFTESFDQALIGLDRQVQFWRTPSADRPMYLEMIGLIREKRLEDSGGEGTTTLGGVDLNDLLRRRIVAYAAGTAQADKTGPADNLMKAIVRENLGSSAIAARDLSALGFAVQADNSLGYSTTKAFAWRNVLEVLRELHDASVTDLSPIYFDIVPVTATTFEFRTFYGARGMDRRWEAGGGRNAINIGVEFGNLDDALAGGSHAEEANYVYAGGQGEGSERLIVEESDEWLIGASVWNRCELFVDARDLETVAGVTARANEALAAGRPRGMFSGRIIDTAGCRYGIEWGFGDRLMVAWRGGFGGYAEIRAVTIEVDAQGNEQISAVFSEEL